MAKNYVAPSRTITIPAPAAVASGGVVVAGGLAGVALAAADTGAPVDVSLEGIWTLPKVSANTFALGAAVYWDSAAGLVTTTASGNAQLGHAVAAAGAGSATVRVRLRN